MDLKSFFDLKKVVFSKKELEEPYEDKSNDVIFIKEDNSYENNSTSPIFNRNDPQKL
jgi:hypothetical protein